MLPYYAGRVKCIYIDPPYNTGSAFEHYDDNLEHSTWLSMMYPRLELLRELLAEDGSLWVNIDDNEGHYLKVIMDEIFGRGNFIANIVWQKKYAAANDHKTIAPMHDHVLVYRKSERWQRNLLPRGVEKNRQYRYEDVLGKVPAFKRYLHMLRNEGVVPESIWSHEFAGHTDGSRKEVRLVLDSESLVDDFITPKPELLISRMLQIATNPGDLVLALSMPRRRPIRRLPSPA